MPIALSASRLVEITAAKTTAHFDLEQAIEGVSFDSRLTRPGELFIALKGETQEHGHGYLQAALDKGAVVCIVEDEALLAGPNANKFIAVSDSLKAFWEIAAWWRTQLSVPILAVTGSVGKTTTKELVRALLFSAAGAGTASDKSFNNHIGVPYTICQISQSDNWAVLEMGMNHSGELHELSLLAQPDVAIITSVEPVHLEFFDSVNGIAMAKLEIVDGLKKEGTLLLNGDCQVLLDGFSSLNSKVENVELFGKNDNAIIKIGSILKDALSGAEIELNCRGSVGTFTAPLPGAHNAYNVAAAVAGVTALLPKIAIADLDKSFSAFKAPAMRLVAKTIGSVTVIDDSYNANPTAMKAALQILVDAKKSGEKVGAILGEMKELGETGPSLHREVGEVAVGLGIDCLIAVGNYRDEYQAATQGSSTVCFAVESPEEAATRALEQSEIKIWLVKASRGARLDKCVNKLLSSLGN